MALTLPELSLPKLSLGGKQLQMIVGGIVVLGAAGWFGWQYLMEEPPAPSKPAPAAAKQPGPAKAAAPPAKAAAPEAKPAAPEAKPAAPEVQPAEPEAKPAAPEAKPARSKSGADARSCLALATNAEIMKCAQKYR
jgi:hypothetical protein